MEKERYLDDNQHKGRNGRATIDIILGKSFTFDTAHFQRADIGCTNCDAKACYNRILPIVLLLAYFKAGLLYEACLFFATLLYNMGYYMTTAFGISTLVNFFGLFAAVFE
eukprot:3869311-Ditylum_brightwellii.AAC.1